MLPVGMVNVEDFNARCDELKTLRDEAKLKIHLGSKDAQDEWAALEKRWHTFKTKAELDKSTNELSSADDRRSNKRQPHLEE